MLSLPSGARLLGPNFILQQENDSKHSVWMDETYLHKDKAGVFQCIKWPPQGTDFNVIETVSDD